MYSKSKNAVIITAIAVAIFLCGYFLSLSKGLKINVKVDSENTAVNSSVGATPQEKIMVEPAVIAPESNSSASQKTSLAEESTPKQSESQPSAAASSSMSTEKIVELYNTAANKVKPEATALTRNYKKLESLPEYLELPSAIQSIGSAAISQFVKGSDTPETWTSKEDMQIVFPVGGTDYTSHLSTDMVESASCNDNGNAYQLEIKLFDDKLTSPAKGEGYAGVFNTVTASSISEVSIPTVTFNKVDVKGINGSIFCTIDKESERVTEITFKNTDILSLNVKVVFSTLDAQIALAVEENYSIQY